WYPAAVLHLDALRLGPLADLGGVQPVRCWLASAARLAPGSADPAASGCIARQRVAQRLGVLGVQVDLVVGTVEAEADRSLSGAAVQVINEQGLHFLRHGFSISRADRNHPRQFRLHEHAAVPARWSSALEKSLSSSDTWLTGNRPGYICGKSSGYA